ncbi:hypothetical protein HJC23_009917 [Cyclotella cryptica]|uniref:Uncharacterized protein n=1 Tax=Cyclotella cryptica TaxID=29204 RepID=A0ABD3P1U6_9STRA|eukprot:CCRYP_018318-RA/>CCRYP_018318-RA protein AED:0.05 eAED:0.08 QI:0/-1/0/1/-1/1/1/0/560
MTPRPTSSDPDSNNRPSSTAPFHSRSARQQTFYQPSVYNFTCRGAFHVQPRPDAKDGDGNGLSDDREATRIEDGMESDIEQALRDAFVCKGIQTKLRHVADYPLARSKDEAIRWFGGQPVGIEVYAKPNDPKVTDGRSNDSRQKINPNKSPKKQEEGPRQVAFSSYGTTQVNVLTVREVPVLPVTDANRQKMNDPFAGFGPLSPSGMMNPFGSIFGGFFGGGAFDPLGENETGDNAEPNTPINNGWMRASRSVSSSTRTHRDENGKRIVTTVTKTTIVDAEGNRRTETETTTRHLDDGGRVETKKVVHNDKNNALKKWDNTAPTNDKPKDQESSSVAATAAKTINPSEEVVMISSNCLFGLAVTDSKSDEPNDPGVPKLGDASKWRTTEYLFRLGRFIPPFAVVSQYYNDKEEVERRRQQHQKEYDEKRQRQKKGRLEKSSERADSSDSDSEAAEDKSKGSNTLFPLPSNLPIDNSRARYYLARIDEQMEKNINMMKIVLGEMLKPEFTRKVYDSGKKIYENMGPTAERTGKLMKDVFNMWVGGSIGWDDGGDSGGGRKR